jgi:hypothetical protein
MPQRQNITTVPTEHLQGAESWVKVRSITVEDWERRQKILADGKKAAEANDVEAAMKTETEYRELVARYILDWNWLDDDGQPLPCLAEDISVFNKLTMEEANFLSNVIVSVEKKTPAK